MVQSAFSYNITRPYPYKWFTSVAIIGGVVFAVLFSLLNYALNGFEPVSYSYTQPPDPHLAWYYRLAMLQSDSLKPNCTAVDFQINSRFFTNQSGLTYILDAVWTDAEDVSKRGSNLPSLTYNNELFQNCRVFQISIELEELDRDAGQVTTAPWGSVVRAFVTCSFQNKVSGLNTKVNLTTAFDAVPEGSPQAALSQPRWLVGTDRFERASLWWGESLLTSWWANNSLTMLQTQQNHEFQAKFRKCALQWMPNPNSSNILDKDFLLGAYSCIEDIGWEGGFQFVFAGTIEDPDPYTKEASSPGSHWANNSMILFGLDRLARSMYSTVMVDLGQEVAPQSNVLLSGEALQRFTQDVVPTPDQEYLLFQPGPATADYETLKNSTGELGVTPSVISTTYLCQLPTRKPIGSLILSILVADLVLLQLAWFLYTFIVGLCLRKRDRVNFCEGCLEDIEQAEGWKSSPIPSVADAPTANANSPLLQSTVRNESDRDGHFARVDTIASVNAGN